jgi:DNA-binding LytR/AlgR family response regulator
MQIAICDDEAFFREELHSLLVEYKTNRRLNLDIFEYSNGNDLLKTDVIFDIVFLDYQMPRLNGMEIARVFRQKNSLCSIVFVTNYPDFVFESFEVNPYRFLRKPVLLNQIEELFQSYIQQQKSLAPIIINDYYGQYTIKATDIVYLE